MTNNKKFKEKITPKTPKRRMRNKQEIVKEKFIQELTINPFIETACRKLKVCRATIYRWLKEDHYFKKATDEAIIISNGSIDDLAKSKLVEAIKNNDSGMIKYHLSKRHKEYISETGIISEERYVLTPEKKAEINRRVKLWSDMVLGNEDDDEDEDDN